MEIAKLFAIGIEVFLKLSEEKISNLPVFQIAILVKITFSNKNKPNEST